TVPSPIDATLPDTLASALTLTWLPETVIVTSPAALLWPPFSLVSARICAVVPEVETIWTGPLKTMPIDPIFTVISALALVGLSVERTFAPGTQGMSLLRSLIAAQLALPLGTENDSLRTGMCVVSLCAGANVAAVSAGHVTRARPRC